MKLHAASYGVSKPNCAEAPRSKLRGIKAQLRRSSAVARLRRVEASMGQFRLRIDAMPGQVGYLF